MSDSNVSSSPTKRKARGIGTMIFTSHSAPWIVKKMVKQPCCVCCSSICTAFALTLMMGVGVMSGLFKLAIDTSPASMKVTDDSIADRGDAFNIFYEETTTGRGLAQSGPCMASESYVISPHTQ
jgi:hypothetical protein